MGADSKLTDRVCLAWYGSLRDASPLFIVKTTHRGQPIATGGSRLTTKRVSEDCEGRGGVSTRTEQISKKAPFRKGPRRIQKPLHGESRVARLVAWGSAGR